MQQGVAEAPVYYAYISKGQLDSYEDQVRPRPSPRPSLPAWGGKRAGLLLCTAGPALRCMCAATGGLARVQRQGGGRVKW